MSKKRKAQEEGRPPKWTQTREKRDTFNIDFVKEQQTKYILRLRTRSQNRDWCGIHRDHFDWWLFPIDDGSRKECNLCCERDIERLLEDALWIEGYKESLRIVARAFGWDIERSQLTDSLDGGNWETNTYSNRDVRLYKMIRSTWLFGLKDYFASLQAFAKYIDSVWHENEGFFYGSVKLADIHRMSLPRDISR